MLRFVQFISDYLPISLEKIPEKRSLEEPPTLTSNSSFHVLEYYYPTKSYSRVMAIKPLTDRNK
jgi:hypothetical protein